MGAPDATVGGAGEASTALKARPRIGVVLIIEHRLFRQGIRLLLEREPDRYRVIGEAANEHTAVSDFAGSNPAVVLIDLTGPEERDRGDAIAATKAAFPEARIIVIIAIEPTFDLVKLIKAGANGYLTHSSGIDDVIRAIEATDMGGSWIDPLLTPVVMAEYRKMAWPENLNNKREDHLGARDRLFLELLASGLSNRQISDRTGLAESTVKNNLSTLFRKINVRDRTQAVLFAIERGIVAPGGNLHE